MVLLLSHKDVDSLLTMESNIKTMEESFIELSKNNVKMTNRGVVIVEDILTTGGSVVELIELAEKNKAIVIGFGGASKAVIYSLILMGFKEINVFNRSFEKLIKDGTICLDFAMHKEKNKVIDKGFLFRIQSSKIYKLYRYSNV